MLAPGGALYVTAGNTLSRHPLALEGPARASWARPRGDNAGSGALVA